jgi:hypothetical protein
VAKPVRISPQVSERGMNEIGARLRQIYSDPQEAPLPRLLSDLLNVLEQRTSKSNSVPPDDCFRPKRGGRN